MHCLCRHQQWLPCSDTTLSLSCFTTYSWLLSSAVAALIPVRCYVVKQVGSEQLLSSGLCVHGGGCGRPASYLWCFDPPSLPCFKSNQVSTHCSQVEYRLPMTLLLVLLPLQTAKDTHLPGVKPQGWGAPNMWPEQLTSQGRSLPM